MKFMDESEYEIFKAMYKSFENLVPINRAKVVYLRCEPSKCSERINQRKRPEEADISS